MELNLSRFKKKIYPVFFNGSVCAMLFSSLCYLTVVIIEEIVKILFFIGIKNHIDLLGNVNVMMTLFLLSLVYIFFLKKICFWLLGLD